MTSVFYQPSLFPFQLQAAANGWQATAALLRARADTARLAIQALESSGFAGFAPSLAYARLKKYAAKFEEDAARAESVAVVLAYAAEEQSLIDDAARALGPVLDVYHERTIVLLNLMSKRLDIMVSRYLVPGEDDMERLTMHRGEDLAALHAQLMETLPANVKQAIAQVDGTVLEAGPGSTTVMVGDTENPSRIITLVAGVSTGDPKDLPNELAKAQRIAERTGATVVVWQGYDPPKNLGRGFSGSAATRGAEDLAIFQLALEERWPEASKSVVSHSYGTVVASRAAHDYGLVADELWLLGSPGVDGKSVDDLTFTNPDAKVYVADAEDDIILYLRNDDKSLHGTTSPSDPSYGAEVIHGIQGGHTDYFDDQVFLDALANSPESSLASAGVR